MASTFVKPNDEVLKKADNEVATVLTHLWRLRRFRNRLCSPLLRLPTETIIRILSYRMTNLGRPHEWRPIFRICHHIREIMRTATELWWEVDIAWGRVAHFVFLMSKRSPQKLLLGLDSWNQGAQTVVDRWKDERVLHGHRLNRLELRGLPSDNAYFSWIFERPLPRLHHLAIFFSGPFDDERGELPMPDSEAARLPITLQLPMGTPLRELYLRNVTLPWSSNFTTGLRKLHLDFTDCDAAVQLSEDELFGILDATSPQLEDLSLSQAGPKPPSGTTDDNSPVSEL